VWNEGAPADSRSIFVPDSPFDDMQDSPDASGDPVESDASSLDSQGLVFGFNGINASQNPNPEFVPPDSDGAVGPSSFIEGLNQSLAIYDKSTGQPMAGGAITSFKTFFSQQLPFMGALEFSDPVVVYNDVTHMFGIGILDFHVKKVNGKEFPTDSRFDFAISTNDHPTLASANWNMKRYVTNDNPSGFNFSDFPKIGYNANGFVVSFNMYVNGLNYSHVSIMGINNDNTSNGSVRILQGGMNNFTLAPASEHGVGTSAAMWLVEGDPMRGAGNTVTLFHLLSPYGTGLITTGLAPASVDAPQFPIDTFDGHFIAFGQAHIPREPGGSLLGGVDSDGQNGTNLGTIFYFSALRVVDGVTHLVSAQTVGSVDVNGNSVNGDSVRWYDFEIATDGAPTLHQMGTVDPDVNEFDTYFPSVDIAPDGTIGLSYSQSGSGTNDYMSMYVTGHRPTDASGSMQPPVLAVASTVFLDSSGRAGDYSFTSVDPVDGTFWAVNEDALGNIAIPNWGTWIQHFAITPPRVDDVLVTTSLGAQPSFDFASQVGSGNQLKTVPVGNADEIQIKFSYPMELSTLSGALSVQSLTGHTVNLGTVTFSYDTATNTGTWIFQNALPADKYTVTLADTATDAAHNPLDGEFINPVRVGQTGTSIFPSGDGSPGGAFVFRFTILPGDVNRDGKVDGNDLAVINGNLLSLT
jgi:hypothetical protein